MTTAVQPNFIGALAGAFVLAAVLMTLYWMLHPPSSPAERVARATERDVEELIGSTIIVVFSAEIHSEHMMALAARLARRARAELVAAYFIEVPLTLPVGAEMEEEHRQALDTLAAAEAIARQQNLDIRTEIVSTRQVSHGVLDFVKRHDAHLIVLGAYREGRYTGAPLGSAIEQIASNAPCDVLIGVPGRRGKLLTEMHPLRTPATTEVSY